MQHEFFMQAALKEAEKALLSGEFPVGCVVVSDGRIIAKGSRSGTAGPSANELDHAEIVALRQVDGLKGAPDPCTMTIYSTMEPCLMCFGAILINGIERIVYAYEDVMGGGTRCPLDAMPRIYSNKNISIVSNILRNESLDLFKTFFSNTDNTYWRGSLLAEYTLAQ
ncbi:MAG: nucleoside deaminase [Deltaproteobacteria bacterium]|nr:nucleoside deaminase [Deltaproteobacteria bacterium]